MKAAIFDEPGRPLRIADVATPEPEPGEAILKVRACGICGSDLHATTEGLARPGGVLGHEVAGEIESLGADPIGDWGVGDRVFVVSQFSCGECGWCLVDQPHNCENLAHFGALGPDEPDGAYAEFLRVRTNDLLAIPSGISFETAAMVEPLATGLMLIRDAKLDIGDTVVVIGGGPIGLATVLWARFFGARRIVMSEMVAHRLSLAEAMGATDTIDASAITDVKGEVERLLGAEPDVVIECVGRPGVLNQCIDMVRQGGTVIAGGVCMQTDTIDHLGAYAKEPIVRFPQTYTKAENQFVIEMIAAGRIDPSPMLSHRVTLDELPDAFEALRRPTDQCKVIVTP
ncbi:MAG: alcohol dehydrogenase catalytic domain-containing protein [Acidimicrobiales bacterium]|nr:alcohol dehydrogenase catalytic domain-containing protein [Acidimicrobiales bacterium]RZV46372.1 MAG: alcohol dehydrogenase [Acidimicrobiales bacterium]